MQFPSAQNLPVSDSKDTALMSRLPILNTVVLVAVWSASHPSLLAEDAPEPLPPEEAARSMVVPEGFNVTLFAGEPDVKQPIGFCMDDRGRLWVAEAYNYPHHGTKPGDRIVILEDSDGDGRHDKRTVFYDRLNYVSGIEVGFGGAWVMSPPYFYFIPDRDGDDRPDSEPHVLLDGFGNHANAHNMANGFAWGPDGWLYGTHGRTNWSLIGKPGTPDEERVRFDGGVYRYHPVRHVWEPYADGTTNPWGIDWNDHGQAFITNCVNPHLFHVIPGAHYEPWRNRKSSEFAYERIPTIADHLHFVGAGDIRDGIGSDAEDAAGGGHAHCGTMIYLGDSFPARYRNTIFTNNIHGRRINNDVLKRSGSSYVASHAPDLMRSNDPWFMGVTLQYGPDGSVFVIDWSDTGECHSTRNTRRETGRVHRISYGTPQPFHGDISKLNNEQLVDLQEHRNDWFVRHARRVLQERAASGVDMARVHQRLTAMFENASEVPRQLRALWALHVTGGMDRTFLLNQLGHEDENVRVWAIQLLCDGETSGTQASPLLTRDLATTNPDTPIASALGPTIHFRDLALRDKSPLVRLYLASMLQRLPLKHRWPIADALLAHGEDAHDSSIPLMLWYGIEPLVSEPERFIKLAFNSNIPLIQRHAARRLVSSEPLWRSLEHLMRILKPESLQLTKPAAQAEILAGMLQGLEGRRSVTVPDGWNYVYSVLQDSPNREVRTRAQQLALVFDDPIALRELRQRILDGAAASDDRVHALRLLLRKRPKDLVQSLFTLLDSTDKEIQETAIRGLAEYDHPETASALLQRYPNLSTEARQSVLQTLASRGGWASSLLDGIESGVLKKETVSAFTVRQIASLGDAQLTKRLESFWGVVRQTSASRRRRIDKFRTVLTKEALAEADLSAGRAVFQKTCANCHRLFGTGGTIGPEITGAQRRNLDYLLENLVDPSAAVSKDYQMEIIQTSSGRVVTGLIKSETSAAVTIQTPKEVVVVPTDEVEARRKANTSMMPDGLLKPLTFEQVRDLIGYLQNTQQVPIPQ